MNNQLNADNKTKEAQAEVQAAIDTLNEFNCRQNAPGEVQFADLIRFVTHKFSESRQQDRQETQNKLKDAVNILKRHCGLFPKLEEGTVTEQNFALFARDVIGRFNAYLDRLQKKSKLTVKEKMAVFLAEYPQFLKNMDKIELPKRSRRYLEVGEKTEEKQTPANAIQTYLAASSQKVSKLNVMKSIASPLPREPIPHLSSQALQLFYMKMITLIEKHLVLSHGEARQLIHQAIIHTELDAKEGLCHVIGTITYFSPYTITIAGAFEKDPRSSLYSAPSKQKHFELKLVSNPD
jgi:hypothetical protein